MAPKGFECRGLSLGLDLGFCRANLDTGLCHACNEATVKSLLSRWVSELEPCIAMDKRGNIIGLTLANAPLGSKPFILRV